MCVHAQLLQPCLTLCDPMDCSLQDFSVHGILQARILEWVAMPSSRGSSQTRDRTWVSCIAGGFLMHWATRKALWNPVRFGKSWFGVSFWEWLGSGCSYTWKFFVLNINLEIPWFGGAIFWAQNEVEVASNWDNLLIQAASPHFNKSKFTLSFTSFSSLYV